MCSVLSVYIRSPLRSNHRISINNPVYYLYLSACNSLNITFTQVLLLNLGTPELFLSQCLQPPSVDQIRQSIAVLIELRALLPVAALPLTALGFHLARMPVDVRIGKMLICASLLGVSVL